LLCALLWTLLPAAQAWGPVGHEAVGAVADELLSRRAHAVVAELLQDDLDRNGQPSGRRTLAEVASWPDEIRGTDADRPHWHYDNRPVCEGGRETAWCRQGECATAQLQANLDILADAGRSRAERNVALKWVVHLVGDMHQPLHEADLAEGGNRIHVSARGRAHGRHEGGSLHAYWDTRLVTLALHAQDGEISASAMRRLIANAQALDPARVAAPPEAWAEESARIAREFALRVDGVSCELPRGGHGTLATVELPQEYVRQARGIVEERLELAGARLAAVLNARLQ
jgi:hypothetical protein